MDVSLDGMLMDVSGALDGRMVPRALPPTDGPRQVVGEGDAIPSPKV